VPTAKSKVQFNVASFAKGASVFMRKAAQAVEKSAKKFPVPPLNTAAVSRKVAEGMETENASSPAPLMDDFLGLTKSEGPFILLLHSHQLHASDGRKLSLAEFRTGISSRQFGPADLLTFYQRSCQRRNIIPIARVLQQLQVQYTVQFVRGEIILNCF
jgi:hypothetical protein